MLGLFRILGEEKHGMHCSIRKRCMVGETTLLWIAYPALVCEKWKLVLGGRSSRNANLNGSALVLSRD